MATQLEIRKAQQARITYLAGVVIMLFVVLLGRLWYLQVGQGDNLYQAAEANARKLIRMRAPRGTILDRKGRYLAISRPQFVVMAVKEQIEQRPEAMRTLCRILEITPEELKARMEKTEERPGSPTRVEVDIPLEKVAMIGEQRMMLPGVSVEMDNLRYYPDGPAVAHIMGQLGEITEKQLTKAEAAGKDYSPGDYVGQGGLELEYEDALRGRDGGKEVMVNAYGRVIRVLGEKPYVRGKALKLTIDRDLQVAAFKAMGKFSGAFVALDPTTGGVLAMVSKPAYDPNVFVKKVNKADWQSIMLNNAHPLQNRAVTGYYPPGSTFKPMMAVAGLYNKVCDLKTSVSCPGIFYFGRHGFKCWKRHGGGVDFNRAVAESCDVWFYNLALKLGIDRMSDMAKQFGISKYTGIDLPCESKRWCGTMPSTEWKWKLFHEKWYPGETPSAGIGQGAVATSPLQMAQSIEAISNCGTIYTPHLMDEIMLPGGHVSRKYKNEVKRKVNVPEDIFRKVQTAMQQTVERGTGRVVRMEGITVGGKTGSAENRGAAHAWFVCFSPVGGKPKIAMACIIEHGRHGASAAAPVCKAVLDVYYGKKKPEEIGSGSQKVVGD